MGKYYLSRASFGCPLWVESTDLLVPLLDSSSHFAPLWPHFVAFLVSHCEFLFPIFFPLRCFSGPPFGVLFPLCSHFCGPTLWILVPFCFHLPQLWVRFWQGRPPFCVAFASGHNMLRDSAVLRDMDPMNGVAATLLPKRNVILGQRSGGSCPLQQFSRNHDHYKRGQDPNALVFNVDGRFESLKRNSAAAVQVLLQGRADPNLATGRRLCRSVC